MFAEVNSEQIGSGNDIDKFIRLGCNVLCHNIGVSIFNPVNYEIISCYFRKWIYL